MRASDPSSYRLEVVVAKWMSEKMQVKRMSKKMQVKRMSKEMQAKRMSEKMQVRVEVNLPDLESWLLMI